MEVREIAAKDTLSHLELQQPRNGKPVKDKETRRILKAVFEKFGKPGTS